MTKKHRVQNAALPYRVVDGRLEVLLVTSRDTGRWILPKGWAEKEVKPHAMAAREAFEEAGVLGRIAKKPFATYQYEKRLCEDRSVSCEVTVFPLEVDEILEDWPEKGQRRRQWLGPSQAALAISDSGLKGVLLGLGRLPA